MPSQPNKQGFYKRPDGAWIKMNGRFKKVGNYKYKRMQHYSRRDIPLDRTRRATKSHLRRRYPQEYD